MEKRALILLIIYFGSFNCQDDSQETFKSQLTYPNNPENLEKLKGRHWTEINFYYDSQCTQSIKKKDKLTKYYQNNNKLGILKFNRTSKFCKFLISYYKRSLRLFFIQNN